VDDVEIARRAIRVLLTPGVRADLERRHDTRGACLLLHAAYASGLYAAPDRLTAPTRLAHEEKLPYPPR